MKFGSIGIMMFGSMGIIGPMSGGMGIIVPLSRGIGVRSALNVRATVTISNSVASMIALVCLRAIFFIFFLLIFDIGKAMYIWSQYKTPDISECLYNTPLPEVRK